MIATEQIEAMIAGLDKLPHGPWFCTVAEGINGTAGLAQVDNGAEMWPVIAEWHEAEHIARCDPDTMRSILEELLRLRRAEVSDDIVEALKWFVDRRAPIQAKFALHGPKDTADAMVVAFRRADAALTAAMQHAGTPSLPQDVIDLVIAARDVAFSDPTPETIAALDKASEAFAERVPWENDPNDEIEDEAMQHRGETK